MVCWATEWRLGTTAGSGFMSSLATAAPWIADGLLVANALGLFRTTERKGRRPDRHAGPGRRHSRCGLDAPRRLAVQRPDWFTEDLGVSKLDKIVQTQFDASKAGHQGLCRNAGPGHRQDRRLHHHAGHGRRWATTARSASRLDKDSEPLSDQEVQAAIAETIKSGSNELAQLLIGTWTETTRTVQRQVVENMGATLSDYGGGGGYASRTVTEQVTDRTYKPSEFAREASRPSTP